MKAPTVSADASASSARMARLLDRRRNYRAELQTAAAARQFCIAYGCGTVFLNIVKTWSQYVARRFDFCCDADPSKWGKTFSLIPCISPSELIDIKADSSVFVALGDFRPAMHFLARNEFPHASLIYKYDLVSSALVSDPSLDLHRISEKLAMVRSMLADKLSAQVFDAIVNRVLDASSPVGLMADVCQGDQYFPADIIRLRSDEVFVDVGAYTGDTASDFVARTHGRFDSIHCFEVDSLNFEILQKTVSALENRSRIHLHPQGLWNQPQDISYSLEETQSSLGEGNALGQVVRLDDVIKEARVTFLKMDIEGAELKALEGARKTILANKPKLAICIYHHFRDLWEIPLLIKTLVPEYRLFLRHHTNLEYESVCYAVLPEDAPE